MPNEEEVVENSGEESGEEVEKEDTGPHIRDIVEQIRKALFGKDVRENIALGIEKCYTDTVTGTNQAFMAAIRANGAADTAEAMNTQLGQTADSWVIIDDDQPSPIPSFNKLWIKPGGGTEYEVPTWGEFNRLKTFFECYIRNLPFEISEFVQGGLGTDASNTTARCNSGYFTCYPGDIILISGNVSDEKYTLSRKDNTYSSGWKVDDLMYSVTEKDDYFVNVAMDDGVTAITPADIPSLKITIVVPTVRE